MKKGKGRFFFDIILLLISEKPTYGYELMTNMREFGIDTPNEPGAAGRIYSTLKQMENQGLIRASWNTDTAPPQKIYNIEKSGQEYLRESYHWAEEQVQRFKSFQKRLKKLDLA